MKVHYVSGKKAYVCDNPECKHEGAEVYSLVCRFINGEWEEVCLECYEEEEVKGKCNQQLKMK